MASQAKKHPMRLVGALCIVCVAACASDSGSKGGSNATVANPILGAPGVAAPGQVASGANGGGIFGTGGAAAPVMALGASGRSGASGTGAAAFVSPTVGAAGAPVGAAGKTGGAAGSKPPPVVVSPNQMLPPVTDYTQPGPFNPTMEVDNTGPGGAYTMYRPTTVDANGFKFIPLTWGNGITTTPQTYPILLNTVASHGFIVIASNDSAVTADEMTQGLDWLFQQNDMPGDLQGKLDTSRGVCMGYSLGGGASVACGSHAKVILTIAMHPAAGFSAGLQGPLLLFSGTNDTVCVPATFVQPAFDAATVPTFFGMLDGADHLEPVLSGGRELAPSIAWLRLFVFGDQGAKPFFYGADCTLCKAPWTMPQSKNLP